MGFSTTKLRLVAVGRLLFVALLLPAVSLAVVLIGGCASPNGSQHPLADALRKTAIAWIQAEPCQAVISEDPTGYWVIGDEGNFMQWTAEDSLQWTYSRGTFYLERIGQDSPIRVITREWLETDGAYEQVAHMVGALADSITMNPYAVLRAGEVINPLVFEPPDGAAWYCGAEAELAEVLQPYFPGEVVERFAAERTGVELHVTYTISKNGGLLTMTQLRQSPPPAAEQVCTWTRLAFKGSQG